MGVAIAVTTAATNLALSFILLIVELRNRREIRRVSHHVEAHDGTPSFARNVREPTSEKHVLEVLVFIGAVIIDHDGYG